jgi:cytoskeletal protein RodZ
MATVLQHPFGTTAFGEFLRNARERRGLTIQQIANETKIPRRLLESLEHGDLGAVPAGMYQRAEIRAYAKAVGLDQTLALSELERALGTRAAETDRHLTAERGTEGLRRRPFLAAACAIAIALLGIVTWYGRITPPPGDDGIRSAKAEETDAAKATLAQPTQTDVAKAAPAQPTVASVAKAAPPKETVTGVADAASPQQAKAAPAQPLITELAVMTDPPGARVIVDGIGRGTTPVTIRYLTAGEKRVRVVKDGFPAQERTVRVAPGREATTLVIPLQGPGQ